MSRLRITPAIRLVKLLRGFYLATACLIMLTGRCLRRSMGRESTAVSRGMDALCKAIACCAADVASFWWLAQIHNHASPHHKTSGASPSPPRFDGHMRHPWLSSLCCQAEPFSTNCPLAVIIVLWYNQLGWQRASLRRRRSPSVIINVKRLLYLLFSLQSCWQARSISDLVRRNASILCLNRDSPLQYVRHP